jgi:hypothetical protein
MMTYFRVVGLALVVFGIFYMPALLVLGAGVIGILGYRNPGNERPEGLERPSDWSDEHHPLAPWPALKSEVAGYTTCYMSGIYDVDEYTDKVDAATGVTPRDRELSGAVKKAHDERRKRWAQAHTGRKKLSHLVDQVEASEFSYDQKWGWETMPLDKRAGSK